MEQGHHTRIILIFLMNKSKSPYLPYELKIFNECNSGGGQGIVKSVDAPPSGRSCECKFTHLSVTWPIKS